MAAIWAILILVFALTSCDCPKDHGNSHHNGPQPVVSSLTINNLGALKQKVVAGKTAFIWLETEFDTLESGDSVSVTALTLQDEFSGSGNFTELQNLEIWADLDPSTDSIRGDKYETQISGILATPFGSSPAILTVNLPVSFDIPAENSIPVAIIADLSVTADYATPGTHSLSIIDAQAFGQKTGNACLPENGTLNIIGAGTLVSIFEKGKISVAINTDSPKRRILLGNSASESIMKFDVTLDDVEDMTLVQIGFGVIGNYNADCGTWLFHDGVQIGGRIFPPNTGFNIMLQSNYVLTAGETQTFEVVMKTCTPNGLWIPNYMPYQITTSADSFIGYGHDSLKQPQGTPDTVPSANYAVYASRPYFNLNASSPSGDLIPGIRTPLAVFNITADLKGDISLTFGSNNFLNFILYGNCQSNQTASLIFEDENGVFLNQFGLALGEDTYIAFYFNANNLIIPAGQTKQIKVFADTTSCTTKDDALQISIYPNLSWGIKGSGAYRDGDLVMGQEIFGYPLVKP